MPDAVEGSGWKPGQSVTVNRSGVFTVERVTASGRAIVNGRTFERDGRERTHGSFYRRALLELISPEIQAEMDLCERSAKIAREAFELVQKSEKWLSDAFATWNRRVPEIADVERAERLAKAIKEVMEDLVQ